MKTISRYIMTLALLLTAVGGAWAEETLLTTITPTGDASYSETTTGVVTVALSNVGYFFEEYGWCWSESGSVTVEAKEGYTITRCVFKQNAKIPVTITTSPFAITFNNEDGSCEQDPYGVMNGVTSIEVYGTAPAASSGPKVAWNAATKTGTFSMPGSDVVLTPIYAKAAAFATTGTEPDVKTLLPEAAEGVIAGTDASLIAEGTGIVAFAAASTEVKQGTLMYAIGTSATEAPALTAFSATVPTAKDVADDGADVLVWYYIKGADAPDGQQATEENTFNDTEPACLTVTVLTNKFDIQFNAANANTIEAGKATVTVGDQPATVTEGKLQGVKMGSEVKLEAKPGYKFRKVEVKKKGAGPLAAAFKDGAKFKVGYQWNSGNTTYLEFTNSGGTYSLTSVSGDNEANGFNSSTLTAKDGNVLALDVVCNPFGSKEDDFSAQIEFDATSSTYKYSSKGGDFTGIISVSVNDTDITSQLTEAK